MDRRPGRSTAYERRGNWSTKKPKEGRVDWKDWRTWALLLAFAIPILGPIVAGIIGSLPR